MLEIHINMLTNAIVGATYAETFTRFKKEAKDRAEAFRKIELNFSAVAAVVEEEGMLTR